VSTHPTVSLGVPKPLFDARIVNGARTATAASGGTGARSYDVDADGRMFLVLTDDDVSEQIAITLNWSSTVNNAPFAR